MHNAFGALTSLASLQAIAAMQGAANLSGAGGIAALGGNVDFMNSINRQANLGGLGGLGINTSKHFVVLSSPCGHGLCVFQWRYTCVQYFQHMVYVDST